MIQLHPYQSKLVDQVIEAWQTFTAVLLVLATGGGKTFIFSWIIHNHLGASAAIVHRKEIVSQISCSLAKLGVKHRIIAPPKTIKRIRRKHLKLFGKSFVDPHAPCGVVSVQTLTAKSAATNTELQKWLKQITLAVYDEGHHYVDTGLWAAAVECMGKAKLLFVTATPDRADGKGLGVGQGGYAEVMIEGPQTQWLIDNGFLAPFKYYAPDSDLNVADLAVTKSGDFNAKALRARVVESHLVGDVVRQYLQFTPGQQAIGFAPDVETANEMAAAFRAAGISSVALNGKTEQGERDRELDKFESCETSVLWNVDLFDEGFDVPAASCAILARPTESLAKYLQMVGRVLRFLPDKTAAIIDPVRNWERHNPPNWPRTWTLNARESNGRSAASDTIPQKVCKACTQPFEAFYTACPHCGFVPVPAERSAPKHVDGDLFELDLDALAAVIAAQDKADMDDADYRASLFDQDENGKIVPPAFHGKAVRRHQAGKYRRSVLKELVAYWIGCQPDGRSMPEKHRRFYHRFGIDIGMAFTLKAADTDALIEKIGARFTEDMV